MDVLKILDILNKGDYTKIKEVEYDDCRPLTRYSSTKYIVSLKEGGSIQIVQIFPGEIYRILLYIPTEDRAIKCWEFKKNVLLKWLSQSDKYSLYDDVRTAFKNIYYKVSMEKHMEISKFFPQ